MGTGQLNKIGTGLVPATGSTVDQYANALEGELAPRDTNGNVGDGVGNLGDASNRWGWGYFKNGIQIGGGNLTDISKIASPANCILSGKATSSKYPAYLTLGGAGSSICTVAGSITPLIYQINNTQYTLNADKTVSLVAAPSTGNTCQVNDSKFNNGMWTTVYGEYLGSASNTTLQKGSVTITSAGSSITAKIGQLVAFNTAEGEVLLAVVISSTQLEIVLRGCGYGLREPILNNDTWTLLQANWLFINTSGVVSTTPTAPIYSSGVSSPDSGNPSWLTTGGMWFSTTNNYWMTYNGSSWTQANMTLLGMAYMDSSNNTWVGEYEDFQSIGWDDKDLIGDISVWDTNTILLSGPMKVNVAGQLVNIGAQYDYGTVNFTNAVAAAHTTSLSDGWLEGSITASTWYFVYCDYTGKLYCSIQMPRKKDLKGWYHPFEYWKCIGLVWQGSGTSANLTGTKTRLYLRDYEFNPGTFSKRPYKSDSPVTEVIWIDNSFTNAPTLDDCWALCNGATISDSDSPLYGQALPNLVSGGNGGVGLFVRGGSTASHTVQHSQNLQHSHGLSNGTANVTKTAATASQAASSATQAAHTHAMRTGANSGSNWFFSAVGSIFAQAQDVLSSVTGPADSQTPAITVNNGAITITDAQPVISGNTNNSGSVTEANPENITLAPYMRIK